MTPRSVAEAGTTPYDLFHMSLQATANPFVSSASQTIAMSNILQRDGKLLRTRWPASAWLHCRVGAMQAEIAARQSTRVNAGSTTVSSAMNPSERQADHSVKAPCVKTLK